MKCPYCCNEIEKGFVQNIRHSLAWYPEGSQVSVLAHYIKDFHSDAVVLSAPERPLGDYRTDAYICKNCKKVIIDYGN